MRAAAGLGINRLTISSLSQRVRARTPGLQRSPAGTAALRASGAARRFAYIEF